MIARLLLLVLLLGAPVWAQSPSPSPDDHEHNWTLHGEEHEHNEELHSGQEYVNEGLHAGDDGTPAIYKFMIRETNSEPYLLVGESNRVFLQAGIVWGINLFLIALFWRRRR